MCVVLLWQYDDSLNLGDDLLNREQEDKVKRKSCSALYCI